MPHIDENEALRDMMAILNEDAPPMPEDLHAAWMQQVSADAYKPAAKPSPWKGVTRFLSVAAAMLFIVGGTLLTRDDLLMSVTDAGNEKSSQTQRAGGLLYDTSYANNMNDAAVYDENAMLTAHAASSEEYADSLAAYDMMMTTGASADNGAAPKLARSMEMEDDADETSAAIEKKIIRTASMTIATKTYEDSLAMLKSTCAELGGWVESTSESVSSSTGLRTAYLTLRVPQTGLDGYLLGASAWGRITRRSETATDVTESYRDTQARLNTQLALMERWQALMAECDNFNDLLTLESQIAETQYNIDSLQSSLNRTDRQVTYSTVDISLREETDVDVTDGTVSLGERIRAAIRLGGETFVTFAGDVVVFLVAALPFIGIVAAAYIVIRIVKKVRK